MNWTVEKTKRWLCSYGELITDIDTLFERADILEMKARSPSSPHLDGMPHEKSGCNDRMAQLVAQYVTLRNEASAKLEKSRILYKEIDRSIKMIKGPGWAHKKAVLQMRYLDVAKWYDVVDMLFGGKEDFLGKEDTYLRRVHKLHKTALEELTEILNQNTERNSQNDET